MRTIFLLLILLCSTRSLLAEIELSGTLENPHLLSGETYLITDDVTIPAGDSLLVDPGVTILFPAYQDSTMVTFIVRGSLYMLGTEELPIVVRKTEDSTPSMSYPGLFVLESGGRQVIRMRYVQIVGAGNAIYSNLDTPEDDTPVSIIERCLFVDCYTACNLNIGGHHIIQNCVFDEQGQDDILLKHVTANVRNCVFLPGYQTSGELWPYKKGISWMSYDEIPQDSVQYNCFFAGNHGEYTTFIVQTLYEENGQVLVQDTLDLWEPNFSANPRFIEGTYVPDDNSPLIDAGDPSMFDPDGSIADIGVYYAVRNEEPFQFPTDFEEDLWVYGYDYSHQGDFEGFPEPTLSLVDAPEGLVYQAQGATEYTFSWPADQQVIGDYRFKLVGYNSVADVEYADTLTFQLTLQENHTPYLVQFAPCTGDSIDCITADTLSFNDQHPGEDFSFTMSFADEDTEILGGSHLSVQLWRNGELLEQETDDEEGDYSFNAETATLNCSTMLDTTFLSFLVRWSDGVAEAYRRVTTMPRYSVLGGVLDGVLTANNETVYVVAPLEIPAGSVLEVEAGTKILIDERLVEEEWLFNISGELSIVGDAETPVTFSSLLRSPANDDAVSRDLRMNLLRAMPGAVVSRISHVSFSNFNTAIQLEYLEDPVQIDHCAFTGILNSIVALGTQADISFCTFTNPKDRKQLGSSSVCLANTQESAVRNCLFVNPEYAITSIGAAALLANNSFVAAQFVSSGGVSYWPGTYYLGYGRVFSYESVLEVNSNLFHWKTQRAGTTHDLDEVSYLLDTPQCAIWLDEASEVSARYNWYDCLDGVAGDANEFIDVTRFLAINDSSLLAENLSNGNGDADFDADTEFRLFSTSPLVDRGDPETSMRDAFDGTRNDIGCYGGPLVESGGYADEVEPGSIPVVLLPRLMSLGDSWPNPFNPKHSNHTSSWAHRTPSPCRL